MKKKVVFFSMYQHPGVKIPKKIWKPSVTQPDESLTIQQILYRVSQGLTTGLGGVPGEGDFDDDNDHDWDAPDRQPDFDKLDAALYATSDAVRDAQREAQEVQERSRKKKAKEDFDKAVDEEIARRKQEEVPQ